MNFKFLIVFVSIFVTQQLLAQDHIKTPINQKDFRFGIYMQYQSGNLEHTDSQTSPTETNFNVFGLGVLGEYRLIKNLFLGVNPEINANQYTFFTNDVESDFKGENLSLRFPLYLNLELSTEENISPTVSAGLAYNLNICEDCTENISESFTELLLEVGVTFKNNYFMWYPYIGFNRSLSDPLDLMFTDSNGQVIEGNQFRQGFHFGVRFKG